MLKLCTKKLTISVFPNMPKLSIYLFTLMMKHFKKGKIIFINGIKSSKLIPSLLDAIRNVKIFCK